MKKIQFFFSTAPCPYFAGRMERKIVSDIGSYAVKTYNHYAKLNFRRSHSIMYVPNCTDCSACKSARIVAADFAPDRTMRKLWKRVLDQIEVTRVRKKATPEQYKLFKRYEDARHSEGDMAKMSQHDYARMVESSPVDTHLYEFRVDGTLVGVSIVDFMDDGLSGVYNFFEPTLPKMSLGTFIIMWLVEETKHLGKEFLYLGYWADGSKTMDYKSKFKPLEIYDSVQWVRLETKDVDHGPSDS